MNSDEFNELIKFDPFNLYYNKFDYSMEQVSNHPLYREGMKTFYCFNNQMKTFYNRVAISAMMDPNEYGILNYLEVLRELKLKELLRED
jgi:hypothetical protein